MSLAAGTRLGPYEIQSAISAGGMGEVYKARDTRLNRSVAIKVLPPAMASDPERRARFTREARTIAGLSHPHIRSLQSRRRATHLGWERSESRTIERALSGVRDSLAGRWWCWRVPGLPPAPRPR
jgi:hypothetical protein